MLKKFKLNTIIYSIAGSLFAMSSCTKVIDINLNNAATKLVIQGNITNVPGITTVTVAKTINFSQDNIFPTVSGAIIKITDSNNGAIFILKETAAGTYQNADLLGSTNHTYLLNVSVNGATYTAASTMPAEVPFDSVTFQQNTGFGRNLINPMPNFKDPANIDNYYQFVESINGKLINKIFVFDDRLSDGKYISRQLFNDSAYIKPGDIVELEMECLDKNVYEYFKQLSGLDPTNGQPTSPTNPVSNIAGGCLGYFSTHTTQKRSALVK